MRPTFSVITPVYNGRDVIQRSYDALALQTCDNWEWIVVDDGSKDGTADIVNAIRDPRVRLFRHIQNRGRGFARSRALGAARGAWMVVWDADDLYFPDRLAALDQARSEGYDYACCYALLVGRALDVRGVRGFFPATGLLPRHFVHHTLGCRLSLARSIGYDARRRIAEDVTLVLTLAQRFHGKFLDEVQSVYVEDYDVHPTKGIASQWQRLSQVRTLWRSGVLRGGPGDRARFAATACAKLAALQLLRLAPELYARSIRFREPGEVQPGWRLSDDRLAFLDRFRTPTPETPINPAERFVSQEAA